MKLKIILFVLLLIGITEEKIWHVNPSGKSHAGVDTTNIADCIAMGAAGDTILLDDWNGGHAYKQKYNVALNPKANMVIMSQNGTAYNWVDTIDKDAGSNDLFYISNGNFTIRSIALKFCDTTVNSGSSYYLINDANSSAQPVSAANCFLHLPRVFAANLDGIAVGTGKILKLDTCFLDSATVFAYQALTKYNTCIYYKCTASQNDSSKTNNCVIYKAHEWDLYGLADTCVNSFWMADSDAGELINYAVGNGSYAHCYNNVFNNNYVFRNNHQAMGLGMSKGSKFYNNVVNDISGYGYTVNGSSPDTADDSCMIYNNIIKAGGQIIDFGGANYTKFKYCGLFLNGSSGLVQFGDGAPPGTFIGDSVVTSVMFGTPSTYPTSTNTKYRDTVKTLASSCLLDTVYFFYPNQHSSNRIIRKGAYAHPRINDTIIGSSKKYLDNIMDTTGTINKTSRKFSIVDSIDYWFRFADYIWSLKNQWYLGDTVNAYLQDSMSGSGWRTVDSAKIGAGLKYTLTDSASGLAGKKVSFRIVGKPLYTSTTSMPGINMLNDTTFIQQDSVTIPSASVGPSVSGLIPDSTSVAGGYKVAINGSGLTGTTVKIGNGGYAGATSQIMTSVGSTVDTITTTAKSRGLYKVYVTDGSANVDSSGTIYYYKASLIYTPSSYSETQNTLSPGYVATDSVAGDPWDSIGFKTALPNGLSLNHSTGAITGTPTVAQSATVYLFYVWKYGYKNDSATITITVTAIPITTVTSIVPIKAKTGDTLTINGSNFGSSQGGSTVKFGTALPSLYVSWSATQTKVVVPVLTRGHYLIHLCASNCDSSQIFTFINLCDKPATQSPVNSVTGVSLTPTLNARRIK